MRNPQRQKAIELPQLRTPAEKVNLVRSLLEQKRSTKAHEENFYASCIFVGRLIVSGFIRRRRVTTKTPAKINSDAITACKLSDSPRMVGAITKAISGCK